MEDDLKKNEKWKTTSKKNMEDDLKKKEKRKKEDNQKKSKILILLKFRGKTFLGLAQLSKIFFVYFCSSYLYMWDTG